MKALVCFNCGASLPAHTIKTGFAVCEFCGTAFRLSADPVSDPGIGDLLLGADFASGVLHGWEVIDADRLSFHRGSPSELRGNYGPRVNSYYVLMTSGYFDDLDAGITIKFTDGDVNLISAGFYPRFTDDGGYGVYISPLGSYAIGYFTKNADAGLKWEKLVDWTRHSALRAGMNQNNRLRVICDGERLRVYLNGVLASSIRDARYRAGKLCVVVEPNGETSLGIALSDLQLREAVT